MRSVLAVLLTILAAAPAAAQDMRNPEPQKKFEQARDRINKALDARLEKMRNAMVESKCKAEAKERYWAIRFNKRRKYQEDCVAQAHTIVADRSGTIP
jgi:hypothetical protein